MQECQGKQKQEQQGSDPSPDKKMTVAKATVRIHCSFQFDHSFQFHVGGIFVIMQVFWLAC
jgi:hypothetical protein